MTRKLIVGIWVILCLAVVGSVASSAFDGRWKDDGNGGCVFDPNDSGPNQCTPPATEGAESTGPAAASASRQGR